MAHNRQIIRGRNASRIRHLVGFSVLIMLIFCTVVIYQGSRSYQTAIEDGQKNASRLARILTDHVELTFLGVDLALRRAIERQYLNTMFGNNLTEYMEQNFRIWLKETPQIVAMAIVDKKGDIKVAAHKKTYDSWLDYSRDLSQEELFEQMRGANDRYVFIGRLNPEKGQPLILMSRRYEMLDGSFGGIVIAAMNPNYFTQFYSSIAAGQDKYMSMTLHDGTVLSSGPDENAANEALIDKIQKNNPDLDKNNGSVKLNTTSANNKIKIMATGYLTNMPVIMNIILDETDLLADWRQSRAKDIGFLALFILFGSVLSFFAVAMARQIMRAEESEETAILASQAKSEFLANMSHELRTPLNAIIGFSEMMSSGYFGPLTVKQKERIHDINLCGTHLLQLISDILEFSKGDAGKLELLEEKVNLHDIISECERIMNGKLKAKNIHLGLSLEIDLPALWGDKRKLRQVMLNLLTNAIKFTPEDGNIRITSVLDAQQQIHITVTDTGIGIPEEDIPKALSVFGQVHRGRSHEGTGLGLPLCKMYTELHGGKLTLSSKISEGTQVRMIFPASRTLTTRRKAELPEEELSKGMRY